MFLQDVFTTTTNTTRVHVNCMEAGSNVFCSLDLATYKYWLLNNTSCTKQYPEAKQFRLFQFFPTKVIKHYLSSIKNKVGSIFWYLLCMFLFALEKV